MGKKYSDFSIRGEEDVPLHLFTNEPGLLAFRTRMGERAYLDRDQVVEVQRFLKKWLKHNKPEPEVIEDSTEPTIPGIFEDIGNILSALFGIPTEIPEDAEEADLVLVGSESDQEKILAALKRHLGLAKMAEGRNLNALAAAISVEDSCRHYFGGYTVSWRPIEGGKIVNVKRQ